MTQLDPTWLELQASEEKFSKAFQSSPALMAISAIDDGRIIDVNAAFVRSLGFTRDELVGHTSLELGLFVDPAQRAVMTQAVQTTGSLHDLEIEVRTKGGDILIGLFSAEVIHLQDQPTLLTVMNDITARKQAETALQHMNALLEQRVIERTRELTEANMHLTELDRLKDEFISRISHELRTPLTSIKAYVELLESGVIDEPMRYFEILRVQTDKLYRVIEDLLDVSRLSRDDVDIHPLPISLDAFINGLAAGRQAEADRRGLKLVTRLNDELPLINTDPALLRQVMLNLLNNALSYTPAGGTITLSAQQRLLGLNPWVIIEVSDTGRGISERDLPHIFEPFYRGEAASDYRTPGAGVGLSIAQYIIEKLGGQITVETAVGSGAVFSVYVNRVTDAPH
ncbi:MAG: PAS domain S-box protein [Thermoflexales bacterium]|nr:PAS domain S-box protein [Thermoflexales bacterium]